MEKEALHKVSVIMPIYNTAAYLSEAIESICNQTLKDLQIILINDGSTDNCQEIIEAYAAKDSRIEWVKQVNAGQGHARNVGLNRATGEYIYFMDSDDILQEDCLMDCYNICYQEHLDYITFDAVAFETETGKRDYTSYNRMNSIDSTRVWNSKSLLQHSLQTMIYKSTLWSYFFRRNLIVLNKISCPEGIIHEDNAFVLKAMLCAKNVKYLPTLYFNRRVRPASTMTTQYSIRNIQGYITTAQIVKQWMKEKPEWEPYISLYLHKTFNSVIWLGHQLTWREKIKTIQLMIANHLCQYISFRNWMVFFFK